MTSAEPRICSIARTLDIVGEKWALLAIREVFLGDRRFDEMVRRTGAPRDTLAARLRTLVAAGILEKRRYSQHPARSEYHLTQAGRDLYPVIAPLLRWGPKNLAGNNAPPPALYNTCRHASRPLVDAGGVVRADRRRQRGVRRGQVGVGEPGPALGHGAEHVGLRVVGGQQHRAVHAGAPPAPGERADGDQVDGVGQFGAVVALELDPLPAAGAGLVHRLGPDRLAHQSLA